MPSANISTPGRQQGPSSPGHGPSLAFIQRRGERDSRRLLAWLAPRGVVSRPLRDLEPAGEKKDPVQRLGRIGHHLSLFHHHPGLTSWGFVASMLLDVSREAGAMDFTQSSQHQNFIFESKEALGKPVRVKYWEDIKRETLRFHHGFIIV